MQETYSTFSKQYWISALKEFTKLRSLVVCALITALRIAVKAIRIPIIPPSLYVSLDFVVNAVGAMVYGPLLGMAGGAVSDTIGAFVFPVDTYFFPYIFIEMASPFVYGLFLYKKKLNPTKIIFARFAVVVVCNLLLNPIVGYWFNVWRGTEAIYKFVTIPRLVKNLSLLPAESIVLIVLLQSIAVPLAKMGYVPQQNGKVAIGRREILLLAVLTAVAVGAVVFAIFYYANK